MALRVLPGLGLNGFWNLGEDGWKDGADANWLTLSVAVQLRVLSRTTSLPGSPSDGDVYVIPTGDANAGKIAVRDDGEWKLITPQQGWITYVADVAAHYKFTGTAWALLVGESAATDAASVTYEADGIANVAEALDALFGAVGGELPLDPAFFFAGGEGDEDRRVTYVATRAFTLPEDLSGSRGYAGTPATVTAGVAFTVQKNGSSIGTVSFAPASNTASFTFAADVAFAAGDRLSILAPSDLDTLEEVSITFKGVRTA